mmetsp:Transcript_3720/g.13716  ORF Transcript_3720/g.13716 Transcript_3720/m.13716 type:complete len:319 (-) Transcript_3720:544-1500(-)
MRVVSDCTCAAAIARSRCTRATNWSTRSCSCRSTSARASSDALSLRSSAAYADEPRAGPPPLGVPLGVEGRRPPSSAPPPSATPSAPPALRRLMTALSRSISASRSCSSTLSSSADRSTFILGVFLMRFARLPKRSVLTVSSLLYMEGEQQMTSVVLELPPSAFCSSRVSFESRYGTYDDFESTSAEITLPSADSDRLIFVASFSRSPVAPVLDWRSEPARSTILSLPTRMCASPSSLNSAVSTVTVKMECERDDVAFMSVEPTDRFFLPAVMTWSISADDLTTKEVRSLTYTPESTFSLSSRRFFGSLDRRSRISSL